jgi:hypothetical protein
MTTLVTADEKGRLPIRGSKPGRRYLVTQAGSEWRVTAYSTSGVPSRNQREWSGPASETSIWDCLKSMADAGLRIEKSKISEQPAPPCRF